MRRAPVRIRTFLVATVLVLLIVPTLAAGAAWLVERDRQQAESSNRVNIAAAYLASHRSSLQSETTARGFERLVERLDLLAQVVLITNAPPGKHPIYTSPILDKGGSAAEIKARRAGAPNLAGPAAPAPSWKQMHRVIAVGSPKAQGFIAADLYYHSTSRARRALVALVSGMIVFLVGLGVAVWLAGRWMVSPLSRLSAQVDKVAGGDLAIDVPRSRIGEVENIAQAVEGMTASLGEAARRQAEADEARRFLVTSVAHDLRTPLFALRGHLQAFRSEIGDPSLHLERAEARADALERLIGNLFAYTRDDYAQPMSRLEAVPLAGLIQEVAASLNHTSHVQDPSVELDGDETLSVSADRDRLKRALTNILDNARRFSPAGAPINVSWRASGESAVEVVIRDHGPGIASELLPHVFEPGIRGSPAPGAADAGAGLGLAIAKRLLEHQGATISAHSEGGATFRLVLQRAAVGDSR